MWVNNNATSSRGVEYRDGNTRTVLKVFMPMIPRTEFGTYVVINKRGKIVEIRTIAQYIIEKHMEWHNELFKGEK
tara:strand:- start:1540 stop:1764 length:225 start_codon:yes stop_codon:yes gene_type:complete